ncbi:MAG: tRNA (adenosine(37)-N6)-threonylcarbamoyltransferase complex dimerization subunit type 1 TsaB [Gammaproteobacteria bacterium]|nr:tRNA (adenosine(37)-N6)-threonylcarbamoyltransferase complex dimerization subunit type 1 TsaB [Gammaproteobacteria bacterium]
MYRMIIDTATDYYYLSILKDNSILSEAYEKGNSNHSETLMPVLEEMLKKDNLKLKDIDEIYTGIGPGSYTGERIAVVIAKMLGAMNKSKIYKFSSLALIASSKDSEVYPFIDARRGNAYVSHFDKDLNRLDEDKVVVVSEYFKENNESLIVKSGKPNPIKLINSKEVVLVDDIDSLSPNYIQLVEAERKKKGLE